MSDTCATCGESIADGEAEFDLEGGRIGLPHHPGCPSMNSRESVYDWVCRCGVRNRVYVKVCGGCGFSDTGEAVAHANGAYSCIAHALGGGEDADDFWYEQAHNVLDALKRKGFVVVRKEVKP